LAGLAEEIKEEDHHNKDDCPKNKVLVESVQSISSNNNRRLKLT
jgi:hypothetical protein